MSEFEHFRLLADTVTEGVQIVDSKGEVIFANCALLKMLGCPSEELAGRPVSHFVDPVPPIKESREVTLIASGGRRMPVRWHGRPLAVGEEGAAGMLVVLEDLTEQKHFEGQLRQAQKMEAVGRLAGGIVHDFNNLLTAIIGYSDLLASDLPANPVWQHRINEILKTAERAADLNQQLLNFIRQQAPRARLLDLNAIVEGLLGMLKRLVGESISLSTVLEPALNRIRADQTQIEQVILNLVINARDAIAETGRIVLQTADLHLDQPCLREHYTIPSGSYVTLVISDSGKGMDSTTLARIFDPFFTTKEQGKGTGIGLTTSYRIVKQCCGFLEVKSAPGEGSTFRIYFPAAVVDCDEKACLVEETQPAGLPH